MGSYRHLTPEDREQIAVLRAASLANRLIATAIGKSPSTIGRELRRNALESGRCSARIADGAYMARRQRDAVLERDRRLSRFVRGRLVEGWSSQQIADWLKSSAELGLCAVAMETIYAFVYRARQRGEELWRCLARRHKQRRPLRTRPSRATIKDRASIHARPESAAGRSDMGHWGKARARHRSERRAERI